MVSMPTKVCSVQGTTSGTDHTAGWISIHCARLVLVSLIHANLPPSARQTRAEVEVLKVQVREISEAESDQQDEDMLLSREEDVLADAVAHRQALWQAVGALTEDGGASDAVGTAVFALGHRQALADLETRLRGLQAELDDVSAQFRVTAEVID